MIATEKESRGILRECIPGDVRSSISTVARENAYDENFIHFLRLDLRPVSVRLAVVTAVYGWTCCPVEIIAKPLLASSASDPAALHLSQWRRAVISDATSLFHYNGRTIVAEIV